MTEKTAKTQRAVRRDVPPLGYFVAWAEGVGGWLWGTYCSDANEYSVSGRLAVRSAAVDACWHAEDDACGVEQAQGREVAHG